MSTLERKVNVRYGDDEIVLPGERAFWYMDAAKTALSLLTTDAMEAGVLIGDSSIRIMFTPGYAHALLQGPEAK